MPQSILTAGTGSYASALSLKQLQQLSDGHGRPINEDLQLTYGMTKGSVELRQRIAELHSSTRSQLSADNVVITPGSIMANYLVLRTLCGPGDHIICQYPTYAQLYVLPRYAGAEVALWKMSDERNWVPSIDDLAAMIRPNTKAIIIKSVL
jgi:aspartate/methionine/tyrosine aminotransferase